MTGYTDKIITLAENLLVEGRVDLVIGFRKGTVPFMNEPCAIRRPEDSKWLVWDSNCGINLANYLADRKEKIGIIAKGCDSRNIVVHIVENKIRREQLHIIGVPCTGMIDHRKVTAMFNGEIIDVSENTEVIYVRGDGFEESFEREVVFPGHDCDQRNRRNGRYQEDLDRPVREADGGQQVDQPYGERPDDEYVGANRPNDAAPYQLLSHVSFYFWHSLHYI